MEEEEDDDDLYESLLQSTLAEDEGMFDETCYAEEDAMLARHK